MSSLVADDSLCLATWKSRRGDFVSLMTLYESNFIRLRRLVGDVFAAPDEQASVCEHDSPLYLTVTERSPYTVTLTMTYKFADGVDQVLEPDLQLRVYRDARLAEALHYSGKRHHDFLTVFRRKLGYRLDARWQRNMMLNKWLEFCLDRGHRFAAHVDAGAQSI